MATKTVKVLKALILNGSTTNVTVPVSPSTSGFSLAFWYYSQEHVNNDRVIDWQAGGPSAGFTILQSTSGGKCAVRFQCNNGGSQTANILIGDLPIGRWHHIIISHNGTAVTSYVNTNQTATDTSAVFTTPAATSLTIGKRAGGSNHFKGRIMEFVLQSGSVFTSAERTALYENGTIPTGATVYYDFERDSEDESGNNNDGTATGATYTQVTWPYKTLDLGSRKALNFGAATAARVNIADNSVLRPETTGTFTWFARIQARNLRANVLERVIVKGGTYIAIMTDQTTTARANQIALEIANAGGTVEYWSTTRLRPFKWYDVCYTFDTDTATCKLYLDGVEQELSTINGPFVAPINSTSSSDTVIGNSTGNDRQFAGLIKDIKQYNVVLSAGEVQSLTNGSTPLRGLVASYDSSSDSDSTLTDTSGNGYNGTITSAVFETVY